MTQDWGFFLGKKKPDFFRILLVCPDGSLGPGIFPHLLLFLVLCPPLETSHFIES